MHIHRNKTPIHIKKNLILQEKVDRNRGRHLTSVLASTCRFNVYARVHMHVHTQTHIYITSEIRGRFGVEQIIKTHAEKHLGGSFPPYPTLVNFNESVPLNSCVSVTALLQAIP